MWTRSGAGRNLSTFSTIRCRMRPSRVRDLTRRFFEKPRTDRLLFLEAVCWLGLARLAIAVVPFRWIAPILGRMMEELPHDDSEHAVLAAGVSRAVATAGRYAPWECKCLARAMAAKMMLKCRGARSTLYLGLARDESGELCAHAWLRYGKTILTGAPAHTRFTVVATFAESSA